MDELKDIHEQEIKNLKDQLILDSKKSNQNPKSIKKSNQNPKSRKTGDQKPCDHQGKGHINLPILLSELNINSSKELISNIEQLVKN